MTLIGLVGPSGSGKTLVGSLFEREGIAHIDCDTVVHTRVYKRPDVRAKMSDAFGFEILTDGGVDRASLGASVFSNPQKLKTLNAIVLPAVTEEIYKILAERGERLALLDAPTLFEAGMNKECKKIIGLLAPRETCISRIMSRDGLTRAAAEKRLAAQKDEKFLREHCDIILENDGNIVTLTKKVLALANNMKKEFLR